MLPWEHLAVGYVLYSAFSHLYHGRPPRGYEAILVAFGTQLPDLIDKPLAWSLDILPNSHSLGHSVLFALPFLAVTGVVVHLAGHSTLGPALAVGYLSHLPTDAMTPTLFGYEPYFEFLLWPVLPGATIPNYTFFGQVVRYFTRYIGRLITPEGLTFLFLEITLLATAFVLWRHDGNPGLVEIRALVPGWRQPAE